MSISRAGLAITRPKNFNGNGNERKTNAMPTNGPWARDWELIGVIIWAALMLLAGLGFLWWVL